MRSALIAIAVLVSLCALCPLNAAASVEDAPVQDVGLYGRSPARVELGWKSGYDGANLRLFSFTTPAATPKKYIVFRNIGGEISLRLGDPAAKSCRVMRRPGFRIEPDWPNDVAIGDTMICDGTRITLVNGEAGAGDDLICVVEPTGDAFTQLLDIHGNDGRDAITGGNNGDELSGEHGDDIVVGGPGSDQLFGAFFAPDLFGERFEDGDSDKDYVYGEAGNDKVYGGPQADVLVGGADNDFICGSHPKLMDIPAVECHPYPGMGSTSADRENKIFADELLDRDLDDSRIPKPKPIRKDLVDCGGGRDNEVQYNPSKDVLARCPSNVAVEQFPAQINDLFKVPKELSDRPQCPDRRYGLGY